MFFNRRLFDYFFKYNIFLLFIFYSLSFGLILINGGIFWDDWLAYEVSPSITIDLGKQIGQFWTGYFFAFITSLPFGVLFQRFLVFIFYFVPGVFLDNILKNIKEIKNSSRFFIILFFLVFPINSARILLTTTHYAVNYFTFYLAFWILSKYLNNRKPIFRFLSLVIFFFSFTTNSLVLFYLIILVYIFYFEFRKQNIRNFSYFFRYFFNYLDFFLLPFLFCAIKFLYLQPYGIYAGYNQIKLLSLVKIPLNILISLYISFIEPIYKAIDLSFPQIIAIIFISLVLFITFFKKEKREGENQRSCFWLFGFGLFSFIVAVIPYLALERLPSFYGWSSSRHQLLIPLGASFILYYSLKILMNKLDATYNQEVFLYLTIAIVFVSANISWYLILQKDWYKQLSLIYHFKQSQVIKNNTSFLFIDNTKDLNAGKRDYRFYEYSGMLKFIFKNETRFGSDLNRISQEADFISPDKFRNKKDRISFIHYKMKDYQPKNFEYKVFINYGEIEITNKNVFKFIFYEYRSPQKFREEIMKLLKIDYVKL